MAPRFSGSFPRIIWLYSTVHCQHYAILVRQFRGFSFPPYFAGIKPEDKLLRTTTPAPTTEGKDAAELTAEAELVKAKIKAMEKGRAAEIIGVTLAFAAVIVIMSVAFIVM